jgi:hypothetical protein
MAAIGDPPVPGPQQRLHAGQSGRSVHRPRPPDLSRQKRDRLRPAQHFARRREHAHFLQQGTGRQSQKDRNPRVLQRRQAKAAFL